MRTSVANEMLCRCCWDSSSPHSQHGQWLGIMLSPSEAGNSTEDLMRPGGWGAKRFPSPALQRTGNFLLYSPMNEGLTCTKLRKVVPGKRNYIKMVDFEQIHPIH